MLTIGIIRMFMPIMMKMVIVMIKVYPLCADRGIGLGWDNVPFQLKPSPLLSTDRVTKADHNGY